MATSLDGLDRRQRSRLAITALLGVLVRVGLVLGLYAVLPMGRGAGRTWWALVLGLLGFALLVAWEAMAVLRTERPGLRAVQALALAIPIFIVLFAALYYSLESFQPGSLSEPLTKVDALYLTVTVAATVGFGDITPVSASARILATVHMVGNLVVLGASVKVLTAVAQHRRTSGA